MSARSFATKTLTRQVRRCGTAETQHDRLTTHNHMQSCDNHLTSPPPGHRLIFHPLSPTQKVHYVHNIQEPASMDHTFNFLPPPMAHNPQPSPLLPPVKGLAGGAVAGPIAAHHHHHTLSHLLARCHSTKQRIPLTVHNIHTDNAVEHIRLAGHCHGGHRAALSSRILAC